MVRYYHGHDLPGNGWAIPDLITTTKLKKFAYQEEYRFAYTKTDAFKFENVKVQLVDRKTRPAPKPNEHFHETLHLGDLHDIVGRRQAGNARRRQRRGDGRAERAKEEH